METGCEMNLALGGINIRAIRVIRGKHHESSDENTVSCVCRNHRSGRCSHSIMAGGDVAPGQAEQPAGWRDT
jgi:hypothetical protein